MNTKIIWTEEMRERVRVLHGLGLSFNEIAQEMGTTRNSVLGLCHRLGLPKRSNHAPAKVNPVIPSSLVPSRTYVPLVSRRVKRKAAVLPEPLNLTILQLTSSTCKWPVTGDGDYPILFCGAVVLRGSKVPYCDYHSALSTGPNTVIGSSTK